MNPVMSLLAGMPKRLTGRARRDLTHLKALSSIRHVSGPRRIELAEDQVGAVVLGQDAAFYLPEMLAHLSTGLGIADVTRALRHYRCAGDVVSRERERAQSRQGARKDLFAPALTESGVAA